MMSWAQSLGSSGGIDSSTDGLTMYTPVLTVSSDTSPQLGFSTMAWTQPSASIDTTP